MLGAWALAFGCSVGWDAIVTPWTMFLPKAGPVGTALGLIVGCIVMAIIAWNFHFMINRRPGPGGVYLYATEAFGHDHGYLCAWALILTYVSIVLSDATAFPIILRYMFGENFLRFGFSYEVAGFVVSLGDLLTSVFVAAVIAAICFWRRFSCVVQTVMAVTFASAFVLCFIAAIIFHDGGGTMIRPAFSPTGGNSFLQFLSILTMAPWLFVGFEVFSSMSEELNFPLRRSFWLMIATLVSAVVAYIILTVIPVLVTGGGEGGWAAAVANVGDPNFCSFDVMSKSLGRAGSAVVYCALIGAIMTNLVGNTIVASRLLSAMADDGALPLWVRERRFDGSPRNAVIAIVSLTLVVAAFGQMVIDVIVDVALVGAAVAYAYTSAATFKLAREDGDRVATATGLVGTVLSAVIGFLFMLPMFTSDGIKMATASYIILVLWCIAGLVFFLHVFRRDVNRRFGKSPIVWISMFITVVFMSFIWIHETTHETTERAYDSIISYHAEHCTDDGANHAEVKQNHDIDDWRVVLRRNLEIVNNSMFKDNLVQGVLNLLALALMLCLYNTLRHRERDLVQEKANAKSYFFSTVSHDIRTPLNAIIGFSEMLKAGFKTEAERDQAVDSIIVSSKTLLGLINDVLDLSKLESGKMDISPEPTDCGHLMRDLTEAFRITNTKPNVDLRCSIGRMPRLMIDPQRLRQIVFNLFGNAMKFTQKGHVTLRVLFEQHKGFDTGEFRLEVEDTGCGISEQDLKRIGSAYVQVGSKVGRNGGTGLGLAICKQLSAAMGGRLEVESKLGKGSKFSVIVPNVKISPKEVVSAQPGNVCQDDAENQSATPEASEPCPVHRLLLVDDSKMNLMVLKALLKHLGDFELETAMNGEEAMKILESPDMKPFDLVLTDMWMPNMDGEALVKAIRAKPGLSSLRVVVVTADVEFQSKYAAMGFNGMLLKPITAERLSTLLESQAGGGVICKLVE